MNKYEALQYIHNNVTFTRDGMLITAQTDRRRVIESFFMFDIIVLPKQLYYIRNKS